MPVEPKLSTSLWPVFFSKMGASSLAGAVKFAATATSTSAAQAAPVRLTRTPARASLTEDFMDISLKELCSSASGRMVKNAAAIYKWNSAKINTRNSIFE